MRLHINPSILETFSQANGKLKRPKNSGVSAHPVELAGSSCSELVGSFCVLRVCLGAEGACSHSLSFAVGLKILRKHQLTRSENLEKLHRNRSLQIPEYSRLSQHRLVFQFSKNHFWNTAALLRVTSQLFFRLFVTFDGTAIISPTVFQFTKTLTFCVIIYNSSYSPSPYLLCSVSLSRGLHTLQLTYGSLGDLRKAWQQVPQRCSDCRISLIIQCSSLPSYASFCYEGKTNYVIECAGILYTHSGFLTYFMHRRPLVWRRSKGPIRHASK